MRTYCITYDLNKPGQNYAGLYEAIKKLGAWWHCPVIFTPSRKQLSSPRRAT